MNETLIYIYPSRSSFIDKDISFLSNTYNVISPSHTWNNKKWTPLRFIQQFVFLVRYLPRSKAIIVMFGGYWSFLPALLGKLFRRSVFIILGGTDCVSFPSLNYGSLRKPVQARFIKWSYQLASRLVPVDESLVKYKYNYHEEGDYTHQGYLFFFPRINTPYKVIYNGFDTDFFMGDINHKESKSFIILANISTLRVFKLKGLDLVFRIAEEFSHFRFTIIGISEDVMRKLSHIPKNIITHPFLPKEEFKRDLLRHEFVIQLSVSEGFPNALCEAMLCGCIPIGSNVGGIPKIIGDTGFLMMSSRMSYIVDKFLQFDNLSENQKKRFAEKARQRIIDNFHISKRQKSFIDLLEGKTT